MGSIYYLWELMAKAAQLYIVWIIVYRQNSKSKAWVVEPDYSCIQSSPFSTTAARATCLNTSSGTSWSSKHPRTSRRERRWHWLQRRESGWQHDYVNHTSKLKAKIGRRKSQRGFKIFSLTGNRELPPNSNGVGTGWASEVSRVKLQLCLRLYSMC